MGVVRSGAVGLVGHCVFFLVPFCYGSICVVGLCTFRWGGVRSGTAA